MFLPRHWLTFLCSNFVKWFRREINEIVRYLPDRKQIWLPLKLSPLRGWIAPKICQSQPPTMYSQCSRFHPNPFTFGGIIAERVNTFLPRQVFLILYY